MMGQHHQLISKIDKALALLSHKVYIDVLKETDPNSDYSLYDILLRCRNEFIKLDDRELLKIVHNTEQYKQGKSNALEGN